MVGNTINCPELMPSKVSISFPCFMTGKPIPHPKGLISLNSRLFMFMKFCRPCKGKLLNYYILETRDFLNVEPKVLRWETSQAPRFVRENLPKINVLEDFYTEKIETPRKLNFH